MSPTHRRIPARAALALCVALAAAQARAAQVADLRARHRAGQTLLTWVGVEPPANQDAITTQQLRKLKREAEASGKVRYRIYRAEEPIRSAEGLKPIAEVPPLTAWNADYHGIYPKPNDLPTRYVVDEGKGPVPAGTDIYAHNPKKAGKAWYAVTLVIEGKEETSLDHGNALKEPVEETVGQGAPVLQRVEKREKFMYVKGPVELRYYVRWEAPPTCAEPSRPYDYLVAVPPKPAKPTPVGIHLHCWGGSLNGGYGWWYNAEKGHMLLASNQIPYDWWTGYHERYWKGKPKKEAWQKGVVRPYSTRRMLAFLDWMTTQWEIDLTRTHTAGSSMGGSGAPMFAIRYPERVAWAIGWVGVHNPAKTPQFKGSYARCYGQPEWGVKFEDGAPAWDHYNDAWYLRHHPDAEIGFITFSNGKNDGGIGWPQAVEFLRALQETRRPHLFVWGQRGHGQRARMPVSLRERVLPIDIRIDQSLPAFTNCSLDDHPGNGDPKDGDPEGQVNSYLFWETEDIVDQPDRWAMTIGLIPKSPKDDCTVDVTPRRRQRFKTKPGDKVAWTSASLGHGKQTQKGNATADRWGIVTLEKVTVGKARNRVVIQPAARRKGRLPKEELDALVRAFRSAKYFWQQGAMAKTLIEAGDPRIVQEIEDLLSHKQRCRRCNAGVVLAGLGDERGLQAIVAELRDTGPRAASEVSPSSKSDPVASDRYYAVHVLGQLGDKRAVPILLEYLNDETINYKAATVLGQLGDRRAIVPLKEMLEHENPDRRLWAGYGLARLNDPVGVPTVAEFLKDPQWVQRRHAADALGEFGDRRAVPALIEALQDENPNVRVSAVRALGKLKDKRALPHLERLRADRTATTSGPATTTAAAAARAITAIRAATPSAAP